MDEGRSPKASGAPGGAKPQSLPIVIPEEEIGKAHRFWDSQPVPVVRRSEDADLPVGPIDDSKQARATPLLLPEGFEWVELDIDDADQLSELYTLLRDHYVEDDNACFRFEYSRECLRWALSVPNAHRSWCVGVKAMMKCTKDDSAASNKRLVAFISGIPVRVNVQGQSVPMSEINFLCVHKTLRSRRLAPVLIKEVTRRVNLENVWQALYTAGVFIPRPVTDCRYFHRPLNLRKLISVGFSSLRYGQTLAEAERDIAVPDTFTVSNIREMRREDVPQVAQILRHGFLRDEIKLFLELDEAEVDHWLLPKAGVVQTYVRTADDGVTVTDVFSYYVLPSTVLQHRAEYETLNAAYCYYANGETLSRHQLLEQTVIAAKKDNHDVLNALDLHNNLPSFRILKFGPGDGSLKFYLYNFQCPLIQPSKNGVILL